MKRIFTNLWRRIFFFAVLMFLPIAIFADSVEKFKLVKSVSELNDSDLIIIGKKANDKVIYSSTLGKLSTTKKIEAAEINISDDIATIGKDADAEVLQIVKNGNYYSLKSVKRGKYLCNASTNGSSEAVDYLDSYKNNNGKNGYVSLKIDATTYNVKIKFDKNGKYEERVLCFKESGEYRYYSCYNPKKISSFQNDPNYCVQIYKYIPSDITISESTDNTDEISAKLNKKVNVALERTLVADKWNTFCLPFDLALTDGKLAGTEVKLMKFGSVEGNVMFFTQAEEIKAGEPYLIKPSKDILNPKFSDVQITEKEAKSNTQNGYSFNGVYSPKTFTDNESELSLFVTGDAKFKHPKANTTMKGMRAYFMCPSPEAASAQLQVDGMLTTISEIVADKDVDGYIYNINGVCIGKDASKLDKGLYIKMERNSW